MSSDEKLSCEKMKSILLHVADVMIESENYLTDLDRACGDGDFGVGMLRGVYESQGADPKLSGR